VEDGDHVGGAVAKVDGLGEQRMASNRCPGGSASERRGVAGEDVLPRDLAAFDPGDAAFAHAHAVGDLLLHEAAGASNFGEAVSDALGHHFAPALSVPTT